jgi:hypothetical protein
MPPTGRSIGFDCIGIADEHAGGVDQKDGARMVAAATTDWSRMHPQIRWSAVVSLVPCDAANLGSGYQETWNEGKCLRWNVVRPL